MIPHPTQETLGFLINEHKSFLTQTEINIPTICLLIIQLNSCGNNFLLFPILFSFPFLFKACLINEFHFAEILPLSDPRTFVALSGTTS